MCLKITLLVESFDAVFKWADEVAIAGMLFKVHLKALLTAVRLVAALDRTDKVFHLFMSIRMVAQVPPRHKRLPTAGLLALKWPVIFELLI